MSSWADHVEEQPAIEPGANAKTVLEGQVRLLWEAQKEAERLETELKAANARVRMISEETIPATLEDMGLDEVVVKGGLKVTVKTKTFTSPKADRKDELYDWLEQHGYGGIIKRQAVFHVGRDNEKEAKAWIKTIKKFPGSFERDVHSSTLKSFVTGAEKEGVEIPQELFGVRKLKVAEVKSVG